MKNFNIFGVHGKIRVLGKVHKKPIYRGDCRKRGGWDSLQICVGGGGLARKRGWYF